MQPIPDDILSQFNVLLDKRSVPAAFHEDYRKWLRYFLDYRERYSPPAERSEQVRLFVEKLRSKGQSGKSLHHAAHALSLFFSLRSKGAQAAAQASETRSTGSPPVVLSAPAEAQPAEQVAPTGEEIRQTIPAAVRSSVQRPGRKYNEWWSLERTQSPEWDGIIDALAGEIKARHFKLQNERA